jgi:flagellar biosynthetic protein FliR
MFGSRAIPMHLRVVLAMALALVVAPIQGAAFVNIPDSVPMFLVAMAGEALVGAVLGMGVMILLSGAQIAGQIVSQMGGLSLAETFQPDLDAEMPALSNLLYMVGLAVFVAIGGHRMLVGALLDTYSDMPIGQVRLSDNLGTLTATLLAESFSLAVRGAAPALVGLLLATLAVGLVSRTLPQMNVMSVGFGLNLLVTFGLFSASIGIVAWLFQEQLEPAVETILEGLRTAG